MERQELHCHECNNYVQFDIDLELNGNHVLNCPVCGHQHCRVVKDGVITDDRWDQRNRANTFHVTNITTTATSTWDTYGGTTSTSTTITGNVNMGTNPAQVYLYGSWLNTVSP